MNISGFVKRFLKGAIHRFAPFIIKRPVLKAIAKWVLNQYPGLRNRLFTITVQELSVQVSDLTPRAARIYRDLKIETERREKTDAHSH